MEPVAPRTGELDAQPFAVRCSPSSAGGRRRSSRSWRLLMLLAGPYWEALCTGKGDAQARAVFGKDAWCATESKTTRDNARAAELRTVVHEGRAHVLWAHLKIGVKLDSDAETMRSPNVTTPIVRQIAR